MQKFIFPGKFEMAQAAAQKAAALLQNAISQQGHAVFIAATGMSQFEFLEILTAIPGIEWQKTTMFHLDEYIGIPDKHPASFRRYLQERLIDKIHPGTVHLIQGDAPDIQAECVRLNLLISQKPVDVAFVGIGENGHLAFNDPPADFSTEVPYLIVNLDHACRQQQLGEGWFPSLEAVPEQAVSMSIRQIMKSRAIVCTVPDQRKANAVKSCLEGEISPLVPASILRNHPQTTIFLDQPSASMLTAD